ncbi:MAG: thioesterase family protein [Candidatus Margulisbacteria bacterium]|nr:thioesterase family protein [Candidatus Margulisiibacteriota bacterium]
MFSNNIKVRYNETDKGGRVYHSNYLVWLDMTRTEFLRSLGISYAKLEDEGIFIVVRKAEIEYLSSAEFDKTYTITIEKIVLDKIKLDFYYSVKDNITEKIIARAFTKLVVINEIGKPIKIPDHLKEKLQRFL